MPVPLPDLVGRIRIDDSDLDRVQRKLAALSRTVSSFGGDAEKGFNKATRAQSDFTTSSEESTKANKKNADSLFEVVKAGALMAGSLKLIKFPAMVAGANLAAQALSALAAGSLAFVSAIAPAAGAVAALPGLLSSVAQAMGVTKLASSGLKDELKALQEASGEPFVPQATKDFAKFLFDMQPLLNQLRETAAKGLFPGLEEALGQLKVLFPTVLAAVDDTAAALAKLAVSGAKMVTTGPWQRDFATVVHNNVGLIEDFGEGGLQLADAFRHITVEALPLTRSLAGLVRNLGFWASDAALAARESGRMAAFFERTGDVLGQLGTILANVGRGLFNIFKGGSELGAEMLASLEKITAQFAEWTSSVSGQNALKQFFDDARQPLKEIGLLIRDIVLAFGDLNAEIDLSDVISQIRTQFLPVLKELLDTSGKLFTEQLITLVTKFVETLSTFGTETGALITFVTLLGAMLDIVNALGQIPGFVEFVATMGILRGTMAAFQFANFITGFSKIGPLISGIMAGLPTLITNFRLLWALMYANPIGLVIAAIAALAAGLIYAYTHSETFRKTVDEAFAAIKVAIATAVDVVIGFLQKMVAFWFQTADSVLSAAEAMFGWIPGVGDKIATARSHFDSFRANVEGNLEQAKNASEAWKNKTIGDFVAIGNKVRELPEVKSITIEAHDNVTPVTEQIQRALAGLKDKTVNIRSIYTDSGDIGARYRHSGGPVFHAGGKVESFHFGGLKSDEVMAKLQVGEFVLQRSAVRALGLGTLGALNSLTPSSAAGGRAAPSGGRSMQISVGQINLSTIFDPNDPMSRRRVGIELREILNNLEGENL